MNPKSNIEMKKVLLKILFIFFPIILFAQNNYYDVVVVGGTPGGIMSAIAASREGKKVVVLERSAHIGGLPANGLEGFPLMDWGLPILRRGELLPVCSESL